MLTQMGPRWCQASPCPELPSPAVLWRGVMNRVRMTLSHSLRGFQKDLWVLGQPGWRNRPGNGAGDWEGCRHVPDLGGEVGVATTEPPLT